MGQKAIRALILRRPKKRSRPAVRSAAPSGHALKTPRRGPYSVIEGPHRTDTVRAGVRVTGWEEWLWQSFYFRSHSRLRCLGLLPLRRRRRPASCAKLSDRARLVTVAPTLSPMPNGKRLSSASGTAESASSAIASRRTDYWLKPRRNARRARPAMRAFAKSWRRQVKEKPRHVRAFFHTGGYRTRRQAVR